MEKSHEEIKKELIEFEKTLGKDDPFAPMLDQLRTARESELSNDVYSAAIGSRFPQAALAQVAKYHGLTLEVVLEIAKELVQQRIGFDLEQEEFDNAIQQVRWIEEHIEDEGLRSWKIQSLSRKFKRTPHQLMECYQKALVNQAPVKPLTLKEFRELNHADIEWIIPGWIPRGTTLLLHAEGGCGKTLFAYEVMSCVLTGQSWNGYQVTAGKVLLVQTDEPSIVTSERMDVRGVPDDAPLRILTDWQADALPRLVTYIEQDTPDLIIIDSLTTINKGSIFSENDVEYARPLLHLRDVADKFKCTIIVIHHSNAAGGSRGTGAIRNSVSEVWGMTKSSDASDRTLTVEKTRLGRPPGKYNFEFMDFDYTFKYIGQGDDEENSEKASNEERIRLWMSQDERRGIPWSVHEVSEFLALPFNTARRLLYELWSKGLIHRHREKGLRSFYYYTGELKNLVNLNVTVEQGELDITDQN